MGPDPIRCDDGATILLGGRWVLRQPAPGERGWRVLQPELPDTYATKREATRAARKEVRNGLA